MSNIDKIDQKIIFFLQQDGKLTNFELAEKVGLSPSPCLRRVKTLEQKGLIAIKPFCSNVFTLLKHGEGDRPTFSANSKLVSLPSC